MNLQFRLPNTANSVGSGMIYIFDDTYIFDDSYIYIYILLHDIFLWRVHLGCKLTISFSQELNLLPSGPSNPNATTSTAAPTWTILI